MVNRWGRRRRGADPKGMMKADKRLKRKKPEENLGF
jgi:hypothetical protein